MNNIIYSELIKYFSLYNQPLFIGPFSCKDKLIHSEPHVAPAFLEKCDWCTNIEIVLFFSAKAPVFY